MKTYPRFRYACSIAAAGSQRSIESTKSYRGRLPMKRRSITLAISLLAANVCYTQQAKDSKSSGHVLVNPGQIQWQPAGPSLPAGAQLAVLDGDPSQATAMYAVALKMPSGFMIGLGDKVVESKVHE